MKDNFDKKLSDRIKEVSNNNEIPFNPTHWNMMQDKMNNNKKRVFFYWKIAAVLLISLLASGIGMYLFNDNALNFNHENPQIILDIKNDSLRIDSLKTNNHIFITSSDFDSITNKTKLSKIDSITFINKQNSKYKKFKNTIKVENSVANNINTVNPKERSHRINIETASLNELPDNNLEIKVLTDIVMNSNTNINLELDSIISSKNLAEEAFIEHSRKDSLAFKKELLAVLEEEKETIKQDSKKSLKFGLEISPIFDYNQDNGNSNVGFAGGITVEIPISNKFYLNTGVSYADQKLNLNQSSILYSDAISARSNSQLINEEAVIKGIEIPLNVTYNFSVAKKDFFIAAGVTSTSYIKENIESNYLVNGRTETSSQDYLGNNIVKYELVQTHSKITTPANSSTFNFANYFNVSLGVKLPINNQGQAIIIAPYFKYSLKPLTKQQIDFNSGGVHLRYNFSFSKN
ncbi:MULTISPECIES: outer membrane beta-barrel protein [Flavobacteriaceae]|uniref:Outer membrane protein beta-barrel domain-containing protein n=2 Tax=Flavobacteriaceae TaxID=49546 RepID=A0A4Y8AWF3_9FLAO|nr:MULTISPECIES: outer membrane beta-barrel protein [Flavobacteriaceae]TEW76809.1 hypothetical protein E2488_02885 [Gramella jeungdoensis]GGK49820.1 hypothetical protein GCM10007963_17740 [Lutibacter litoralis]